MTTTSVAWHAATEVVDAAGKILIVTHLNPDGDAIGSLLGLANALRARGCNVDAAVDGGVPDDLRFLPGAETVLSVLSDATTPQWDLMISLDASDEGRTGQVGADGRARSRTVVNIDHHPTNTMFGGIHLVVPEAVSTTEIILHWLDKMGCALTPDIAVPLLTGLVTDTRGFRTSNVTAATLRHAQRLVDAGASLSQIMAQTLDNTSFSVIELWKYALPSVQLDNLVISANVTQSDLARAHVSEVTDGGLVSFLVSAQQAMIAVVFKELADGQVEISLRSKPGYDVSQVALSLGGGGHRQASGATIPGPLQAARERVLPLLHEIVQQKSD